LRQGRNRPLWNAQDAQSCNGKTSFENVSTGALILHKCPFLGRYPMVLGPSYLVLGLSLVLGLPLVPGPWPAREGRRTRDRPRTKDQALRTFHYALFKALAMLVSAAWSVLREVAMFMRM
jgi:hypothetical protein